MKKCELILEKRHAKFMVDFYEIHKSGSDRAMSSYKRWLKTYNDLKNKVKEFSKK